MLTSMIFFSGQKSYLAEEDLSGLKNQSHVSTLTKA